MNPSHADGPSRRGAQQAKTMIRIRDAVIGGDALHVIGGPSDSVSYERFEETARLLRASGGTILR